MTHQKNSPSPSTTERADHQVNSPIRLIPEISAGAPEAGTPYPVPRGVSALDLSTKTPTQPEGEDNGLVVEPHTRNGNPKLLVVNFDPKQVIRVNDQKHAIVALVNVGDFIRIGNGPLFEVAWYHEVQIGPPGPEQLGRCCPVCLDEIVSTSSVLTCPCGCCMHLETEGGNPMECGLAISACPQCDRPIKLEEGFFPEPEFLKE